MESIIMDVPRASEHPLLPVKKDNLITRRLDELLGGNIIKGILAEGTPGKAYWAHIGYYVPLTKITDFFRADVHIFLDNLKAPLDLVTHRTKYYEFVYLPREYNLDNYKLCTLATEHDAKKAGSEVVKQVESPLSSRLIYPGLQALDEQLRQAGPSDEYHGPWSDGRQDVVPGPGLKYRLFGPAGNCEGNVTEDGLFAFAKAVLIPISELRLERRQGDTGEDEEGKDKESVKPQKPFVRIGVYDSSHGRRAEYRATTEPTRSSRTTLQPRRYIHPGDLKANIRDAIISLLEPIRAAFLANEEWQQVEHFASWDPKNDSQSSNV
ncbi:tyrosyl-tRNA synthetase [Boletus edulis]|nr:tyrosyl-tRNA synthetase [Boletus edulis]